MNVPTHHLASYTCPKCGKVMDAATSVLHDPTQPKAGDISICLYCRNVAEFTADLTLRTLTNSDIAKLKPEHRAIIALTQIQLEELP